MTASPFDPAAAIEATHARYALSSTQLVPMDDPAWSFDDAAAQRANALRSRILLFTCLFLSTPVLSFPILWDSSSPSFDLSWPEVVGLVAIAVLCIAFAYWVDRKLQALTQPVYIFVPQNVRDSYYRIAEVATMNPDAPDWIRSAAAHASGVVAGIAAHHVAGTGSGPDCARLGDALFFTAARVDTWHLITRLPGADERTLETEASADALLMSEAAESGVDHLGLLAPSGDTEVVDDA